jgi:protein MpaA
VSNKLLSILLLITVFGCTAIRMRESEDHKQAETQIKEKIILEIKEKKPFVTKEKQQKFCGLINQYFKKYKWGNSYCEREAWQSESNSVLGTPLVWSVYGENTEKNTETTLILCGVHGDEVTPIKFCFDVINHLRGSIKEEVDQSLAFQKDFEGKRVIIVPVVNPDSFFKRRPTRTNANGVDINRNLPTKDFTKSAVRVWKERYRSDKRRNPGVTAMSEPESRFQVELIKKFGPQKIISVHAPLTMLDYDGPVSENSGGEIGSRANQLLITMSEQARGYRIKNYPFFPGSLGNYAGNERSIPTFTLELPTSDPSKTRHYWALFKDSIHSAMTHQF